MDLVAHLWGGWGRWIHPVVNPHPEGDIAIEQTVAADDGGHPFSTLGFKAGESAPLETRTRLETAVAHADAVDLDGVFAWVNQTERSITFQRYNPDTLSRELHDLPDGTPAIQMFRLDGTLAEVK